MSAVTMVCTGQYRNLHTMAGIFSLDNIYQAEKIPLLVRDMLVNFGDVWPETSTGADTVGGGGGSWVLGPPQPFCGTPKLHKMEKNVV